MPAARLASIEFAAAFRERAGDAVMNFAQFMELALYHPNFGYYRRDRSRVGYGRGTDFFTASTSGAVFGELVAAACVSLLGAELAAEMEFVEIGAESGGGVLDGVAHPFRSARTIALGEPLDLNGACVVFSNELFDAQPFRRFIFRQGSWRELGVKLDGVTLSEFELPDTAVPEFFPPKTAEGYTLDAPLAAAGLAGKILSAPWRGLFVACDYGKSWRELIEACPSGTARAYRQHQLSSDLLAYPSEQDLTCHICWDWLVDELRKTGFAEAAVDSHEAFFVRNATEYIARVSTADAAHFSQRKLSLLQLLHPSHLGQKFQVLHALRR